MHCPAFSMELLEKVQTDALLSTCNNIEESNIESVLWL